ncbi:DUF3050 domain-containing protein [Acidicapsa ligni]|uniref:DUF3050 domain-containing protein n=1 Tax=Acidicapsa ligni TaxID=542300 RepID=UPI0021DF7A4D|nr:DUF3050 domain-containing protein [Acidicapsa ligni]
MYPLISAPSIDLIAARIAPVRARLAEHPLYSRIQKPRDLQIFMESHVFAVWDFMSLLKALQARLTCVTVPWQPTPWPASRRFINEIVLGEESDLYQDRAISHFELYLEAMQESGADTAAIQALLTEVAHGTSTPENLNLSGHLNSPGLPVPAKQFVTSTFERISSGQVHTIAAAFTFGREDVIPDMFRSFVRDLDAQRNGQFAKFLWYLERHIEVDGEDHGPLSLRMVADLCGNDEQLWEEAANAAESALQARINLWDGILAGL